MKKAEPKVGRVAQQALSVHGTRPDTLMQSGETGAPVSVVTQVDESNTMTRWVRPRCAPLTAGTVHRAARHV